MYRLLISKIFVKNNILKNKNLEFKCEISKISYPVNIKVTNRKKTISVCIDKNKILVNTPYFVNEEYILKILEKKRKWISKVILENNEQYTSGLNKMEIFYLGKKYKINLKKDLNNEKILKNNNLEIIYRSSRTAYIEFHPDLVFRIWGATRHSFTIRSDRCGAKRRTDRSQN